MAGVALWLGLPAELGAGRRARCCSSPTPGEAAVPFLPFLWPGWTLFYELVFYAIFGGVRVRGAGQGDRLYRGGADRGGRQRGDLAAGDLARRRVRAPDRAAVRRRDGGRRCCSRPDARCRRRCASLPGSAPSPSSPWRHGVCRRTRLGWDWLAERRAGRRCWRSSAVAGGPIPAPPGAAVRRCSATLSYALYLLHIPFAHAWMQVFNVWLPHPGGSIGYMAGGLAAAARRCRSPFTAGSSGR